MNDADYATSHKRWFYNENWAFVPFSYNMPVLKDEIPKPPQLAAMKNISKALAYSFTRVDLYEVNSRVFAGELTFSPFGGVAGFNPPE